MENEANAPFFFMIFQRRQKALLWSKGLILQTLLIILSFNQFFLLNSIYVYRSNQEKHFF